VRVYILVTLDGCTPYVVQNIAYAIVP